MKTRTLLASACAVALLSPFNVFPAYSAVIHVPGDKPTIQSGIDVAAPGDTVLVAAGTYFGSLEMRGGVNLRSETGQYDCVTIDGTLHGGGIQFVSLAGQSLLEGFTITGTMGDALYFFESEAVVRNCHISDNHFGGVSCRNSSLSIFNCVISNNFSASNGGGMYVHGSSSLTMENCKVIGNTSYGLGGGLGIYCPASISECIFEGNSAGINGGGVWCYGEQTFDNCTFMENSAQRDGGGVFVNVSTLPGSYPEFIECRILGNSAVVGSGGGISCIGSAQITECLIVDNSAGKSGGGLHFAGTDSIVVNQCTIVGNSADFQGGGIYSYSTNFQLTTSIIAFSREGEGVYCYGGGSALEISLCDIFGNKGGDQLCGFDRGGNFSEDPLFCNMASGNFFLDQGSPCLIGSDPYFFVIGAQGMGDCSVAPVDDPDMVIPADEGLLGQNHPNPFNPRTVIPFVLKEPGRPVLRIFDIAGREIITLLSGEDFAAGRSEVIWNGRDSSGSRVPSGLYFYRLDVQDFSETRRMVLMK